MKTAKCLSGCLAAIAVLLASCSAAPTKNALATADYGRDMAPEECVSIAQKVISDSLKDPLSAQFRNGQCVKDHWNSVPLAGMGVEFGWLQSGEVNGKNAYGGYVGYTRYQVLIKDGLAVRWCVVDANGTCFPSGR